MYNDGLQNTKMWYGVRLSDATRERVHQNKTRRLHTQTGYTNTDDNNFVDNISSFDTWIQSCVATVTFNKRTCFIFDMSQIRRSIKFPSIDLQKHHSTLLSLLVFVLPAQSKTSLFPDACLSFVESPTYHLVYATFLRQFGD